MSTFDVDTEEISAKFENRHLSKKYFNQNESFDNLKTYYSNYKYRSEIPDIDIDEVIQKLYTFFCQFELVDDLGDKRMTFLNSSNFSEISRMFVVKSNRESPDNSWIKNKSSVRQVVEEGTPGNKIGKKFWKFKTANRQIVAGTSWPVTVVTSTLPLVHKCKRFLI